MKYTNPTDVTMKVSWQHPSIMRGQEKIIGFSMDFLQTPASGESAFWFRCQLEFV
jgi:hypothetical protein